MEFVLAKEPSVVIWNCQFPAMVLLFEAAPCPAPQPDKSATLHRSTNPQTHRRLDNLAAGSGRSRFLRPGYLVEIFINLCCPKTPT